MLSSSSCSISFGTQRCQANMKQPCFFFLFNFLSCTKVSGKHWTPCFSSCSISFYTVSSKHLALILVQFPFTHHKGIRQIPCSSFCSTSFEKFAISKYVYICWYQWKDNCCGGLRASSSWNQVSIASSLQCSARFWLIFDDLLQVPKSFCMVTQFSSIYIWGMHPPLA